MAASDVLIVGGGAVGVACAYELARRGAAVTLLEREREVGLGCSYGNAGLVGAELARPLATPQALREGLRSLGRRDAPLRLRPAPAMLPWLWRFALACRPRAFELATRALLPLGADSFRMHLAYQAAGLEVGIDHRGALLAWETAAGLDSGIRELGAGRGAPIVLDGGRARELAPALAGIAGAVVDQGVAHCDSGRWTRGVAAAAGRQGARIRTGVEMRRLLVSGHRVHGLETDEGRLEAGLTVLAAGVWSGRLLAGTGVDLHLQAGKGYHVDLARQPDDPGLPIYLQEAHVVATPLADRLRLAGTLDLTGVNPRIDRRRAESVLTAAARSLPSVRGREVLEVWAGLRPCTADGMPTIGEVDTHRGLLVAAGHAMIGLALAPVTGKLIAELASGEPPSHHLAAFHPARF